MQSLENFVNGSFVCKISTPSVAQTSLYALVRSTGAWSIISDCLWMSSFHLSSCVHGYHVHKDVWMPHANQEESLPLAGKQVSSLHKQLAQAGNFHSTYMLALIHVLPATNSTLL